MANKSEHIEPKPTMYRGNNFKSRLEARWAVMLDHLVIPSGLRMNWQYEPITFKIMPGNWEYTPDFLIRFTGAKRNFNNLLIEVKPIMPDAEVMATLLAIHNSPSAGSYLVGCGFGSFYKSEPELADVSHGDTHQITHFFSHHYGIDAADAVKKASSWRFDLVDQLETLNITKKDS